jgi:IrrE N-terminal-like domain
MWTSGELEFEARKLLGEIEKHAAQLWPNTPPSRLFMCDPAAACQLLGLKYLPDQHLGMYGGTATAGILDRARKAVLLSSRQRFEALRFTAAHEVGHFILHPGQVMFRDRSLSSHGGEGRPRVEWEADVFAASFLMPPKLLVQAFRARFPTQEPPLTNTGTVCFNLSVREAQYLESLPAGSREFALAVARSEFFAGEHFKSLAQLFCVSPTAMAIRLQEMGLVS